MGPVQAAPAYGQIQESVLYRPDGPAWRSEPFQLQSSQIGGGMSGAPVLAAESNLVIGLIFATWEQKRFLDRDTAWAVDAATLAGEPFNLPLREEPLPLEPPTPLRTDVATARRSAAAQNLRSVGLPDPVRDWVGRTALLHELTEAWGGSGTGRRIRVVGLIGFGGEGKSSLARHWLDQLAAGPPGRWPDGAFWWTFNGSNTEEFFEAALQFVGGDATERRSASARAHYVVAAATGRRYVFVLDGLEQAQYESGDRYGLCRSEDLATFLTLFADNEHPSLCIVTSRAPLVDLLASPSYERVDLDRLTAADGRDLLRRLGVHGADMALEAVVERFGGHALTLTLVGAYLAEVYNGKVERVDQLPLPVAGQERRYAGVRTILERYDQHLTSSDRTFLHVLSTFRRAVFDADLPRLFRPRDERQVNGGTAGDPTLDDPLDQVRRRLIAYRILRINVRAATVESSLHPLVRDYYYEDLAAHGDRGAVHRRVQRFYLELAREHPTGPDRVPTLEELAPLIEAVHHACRGGEHEEGYQIYIDHIDQRRGVLVYQLGAYATDLDLALEFFPDGAVSREPRLADPAAREYLVRSIGLAFMTLGRLYEAFPVCRRSEQMAREAGDYLSASKAAQLLAELDIHVGQLQDGVEHARLAERYAAQVDDPEDRRTERACSLAYEGWCHHLRGDVAAADDAFDRAERVQRSGPGALPHLDDLWGIYHAEHLLRRGDRARGAAVLEFAASQARDEALPEVISESERLLGDYRLATNAASPQAVGRVAGPRADGSGLDPQVLAADCGVDQEVLAVAMEHYNRAVRIALGLSHRAILLEALIGRGRCAGFGGDLQAAQNDLDQAVAAAHDSGYRIYEADARLALAYHRAGARAAARTEVSIAEGLSAAVSYHWATRAAQDLLALLDAETAP
jgi:tetratricopeptide (TPR) repeat protein